MLRIRPHSVFSVLAIGVTALAGAARAQDANPGALSEMPLVGSLRSVLAAIDDRTAADRSQFLLEVIRRLYERPITPNTDARDRLLQSVLASLNQPSTNGGTTRPETLPLPLTTAIWRDTVLAGHAPTDDLVSAVLRSRNLALLYYGLLSVDDATRAWLAGQPDVVADLATRRSALFVVAAPGLRVSGGVVQVPGGDLARPAWEALVGRPVGQPSDFVRGLLTQGNGRLAYFYGAIAQLTPAQIDFAMSLGLPDPAARGDAARRLYAVFERAAPHWDVDERTFWRPALDPALLVADLRTDATGRPMLAGTRRFWTAVFDGADPDRQKPAREDDLRGLSAGEPADFVWLCEQVFNAPHDEERRRYQQVLFASRIMAGMSGTARDAVYAVRAAGDYPALIAVLERAKVLDIQTLAKAARRASQLSALGTGDRAVRAVMQYQGTLALLTRAALRRSLPSDSLSDLVSSLSDVDLGQRGDYEGRLVRWLDEHVRQLADGPLATSTTSESTADIEETAAGPLERDLLRLLSGPSADKARFVDWEGTRYRVDLVRAEAGRLARMLGENPRPFLSAARTTLSIADALDGGEVTAVDLRRHADSFEQVAHAVGWDTGEVWKKTDAGHRSRQVADALARAARGGDLRAGSRCAPALRLLADDLLARGLLEFVYAAALGQPDRASISASDAAIRHDLGFDARGPRPTGPWALPLAGADSMRGWRVTGSLLGLDVKLAEFSLVRLSSKPPLARPSLNESDRRVLIEAVALVESPALLEEDRDRIVAAIRKGRARLAAVRTAAEAVALADEIRLSPARRALLPWILAHEPDRLPMFLSPGELLWLGLDRTPVDAALQAWGAPGEPRLGCLCLQLIDRRPWETLAGRWNSGIFASGFPDLNLRLAELLTELQMPAALLGPVLAPATLDFVNSAVSRGDDDRRGLTEFVQGLRAERVEEYLALLTTDGPLVPVGDAPAPQSMGIGSNMGKPR